MWPGGRRAAAELQRSPGGGPARRPSAGQTSPPWPSSAARTGCGSAPQSPAGCSWTPGTSAPEGGGVEEGEGQEATAIGNQLISQLVRHNSKPFPISHLATLNVKRLNNIHKPI